MPSNLTQRGAGKIGLLMISYLDNTMLLIQIATSQSGMEGDEIKKYLGIGRSTLFR